MLYRMFFNLSAGFGQKKRIGVFFVEFTRKGTKFRPVFKNNGKMDRVCVQVGVLDWAGIFENGQNCAKTVLKVPDNDL